MQWPGLFASYAPHFNSYSFLQPMAYPSHPAVALFNPQWPPQPSLPWHQSPPPMMMSPWVHPWSSPARPYYYQPPTMSWAPQQPPQPPMLSSSASNHTKQSSAVSHVVTRPVDQRPLDVLTTFGSLPTYATIGIPKSSSSAIGQYPSKHLTSQNTSSIHSREDYPNLTPELYRTIPDAPKQITI